MYLFQTEALTPSVALPFGFPCLSRAGVPARVMPPPANRRRTEREIGTVDLGIGFPAPRLVIHLPYRWALADGFPALPAGCPVRLSVLYPVLIRGASSAIYVQFKHASRNARICHWTVVHFPHGPRSIWRAFPCGPARCVSVVLVGTTTLPALAHVAQVWSAVKRSWVMPCWAR